MSKRQTTLCEMMCQSYHKDDGTSPDKIAIKTLLNDPAGGMDVKSSYVEDAKTSHEEKATK